MRIGSLRSSDERKEFGSLPGSDKSARIEENDFSENQNKRKTVKSKESLKIEAERETVEAKELPSIVAENITDVSLDKQSDASSKPRSSNHSSMQVEKP